MKEVYEALKEYVLRIMDERNETHPQEIAILPQLIQILDAHSEKQRNEIEEEKSDALIMVIEKDEARIYKHEGNAK